MITMNESLFNHNLQKHSIYVSVCQVVSKYVKLGQTEWQVFGFTLLVENILLFLQCLECNQCNGFF